MEDEEDPWEGRWFWAPELVAEEHRWRKRFLRLVKAVRPEIPEPRVEDGFTKQAVFNPGGQAIPRDVWTYKGYPWSWLQVVTGEERRIRRTAPRDSMKRVWDHRTCLVRGTRWEGEAAFAEGEWLWRDWFAHVLDLAWQTEMGRELERRCGMVHGVREVIGGWNMEDESLIPPPGVQGER